ncbi:alpha/beta hydrolase [Actinophytocola sp.]|uniref:alpha/beta fold hydrolase n=1 Tax=Actinophytocola sp. TaxID=1872138 RepID=UPI002D800A93|nr:alpha/beta hydrolase [Actinophytocola sp.]HET9138765.1 alpha/beta hydrolase [Actinophytocola sp.]
MTAEVLPSMLDLPTDEELAASLPGEFRSDYLRVNGIRLHYVSGGTGEPLVLLPAWPQTWWEYRKMMPALAQRYRVIVVEVRGMGGSDKPAGGYDKKSMARDVYEFVRALGYERVNIVGHDIGAMVAFSFAVNHPDATRKLALLDVAHPDESRYEMRLVPRPGAGFNMWWWAFNQVPELPERLLAGRAWYLVDWLYGKSLVDQDAIGPRDRAIYARAYDTPEAIRATNGWYQAFHQDIADMNGYGKVTAPILGLGCPINVERLQRVLPEQGTDVRVVRVDDSSHWIPEEQPELVSKLLLEFFE